MACNNLELNDKSAHALRRQSLPPLVLRELGLTLAGLAKRGLTSRGLATFGLATFSLATFSLATFGLAALGLSGCSDGDPNGPWTAAELRVIASLTPPPGAPASPGNRLADDERAARLGQRLFFDKRLSANGQVACATCHVPEKYFTDGLRQAKGIGATSRNAPTVLGAAWFPFVFHDGRKDSLWSQALGPVEAGLEHGFDRTAVAQHIVTHYPAQWRELFGNVPDLSDTTRFPQHARPIDLDRSNPSQAAWTAMRPEDRSVIDGIFAQFGKVIEAYERRLMPQPSPFDLYAAALRAGDPTGGGHLSKAAQRGLRAFIGPAGCVNCHNGPMWTDRGFHNLGLAAAQGEDGQPLPGIDGGRTLGAGQVKRDPFRCGGAFSDTRECDALRFLDPRFQDFLGAFKTPSLRNVARTAPYFHAGQAANLVEVVDFYRILPGKARIGHRELTLQPLPGSVDAEDLVALLESLTGPLPPGSWTQAPAPVPAPAVDPGPVPVPAPGPAPVPALDPALDPGPVPAVDPAGDPTGARP